MNDYKRYSSTRRNYPLNDNEMWSQKEALFNPRDLQQKLMEFEETFFSGEKPTHLDFFDFLYRQVKKDVKEIEPQVHRKLHCGSCEAGAIDFKIMPPTSSGVQVIISKCSNCGLQYLEVEQLQKLKPIL